MIFASRPRVFLPMNFRRRTLWMVAAAWCWVAAVSAASEGGDPVERYVRYGFTLQNTTGERIPEAVLWVCAPLRETSLQRLRDLNASHPYEQQTDALGNHLLRFVFSNVPPYAVRVVSLDANLELGAKLGREEPDPAAWLASGPLLEFDDEAFDRLAPVFAGDAPDRTARQIYDWVRGHLQDARYDGTDRGARYALIQQKGDCTEYAMLFTALCRRAGIPARAMGGYVVSRNAVLDPVAYHNWAEFHVNGRWHLADPLTGVFMDGEDSYVAIRILGTSESPLGDFPRFRHLGAGIKVMMNK